MNLSNEKDRIQKNCDEILECDKNIRYVGVYDYGELYDKIQSGKKSLLSREETKLSLSQVVYRWSTRKKTSEKIGKPIFVLAKYEKIYRVTISIVGAGLILISAELNADINGIVDNILKIKNKYS